MEPLIVKILYFILCLITWGVFVTYAKDLKWAMMILLAHISTVLSIIFTI